MSRHSPPLPVEPEDGRGSEGIFPLISHPTDGSTLLKKEQKVK